MCRQGRLRQRSAHRRTIQHHRKTAYYNGPLRPVLIATTEPSLLEGPDDPGDPMLEPVLRRGQNENGGTPAPQKPTP